MQTKNKAIIALYILLLQTTLTLAQVGTWRAYMAYHDITDVQKADKMMYVLASNGLYSYNTNDQSIQTFDKTNGLSDCEIQYIAWCQEAKRLLIAYSNGNFDVMDNNGNVTNLPDFYNKTMTEDKTLYDVTVNGKYAYVSTGFGIMKIDVADASINETYNLGFRVNYCYISGNNIYAASSTKGTYTALMSNNLQDPSCWSYTMPYSAKEKTIDSDLLQIANTLNPGGPKYNYFNYMYFKNNRLYTSGGGWTVGTEYFRPGCIQVLEDKEWNIYQDDFDVPGNITYQDATALAVDPSDPNHVFAGNIHSGLFEFRNSKFTKYYNFENSKILSISPETSPNHYKYVRIDGLVYDNDGNLFMFNPETSNGIVEFTNDGQWAVHNFDCLFSNSSKTSSLGILRRAMLDSRGLIWFVNDHSGYPSLFCFDPKENTIVDYHTFKNQDGTQLSIEYARYVKEDKDNNIWLCTDMGPYMLTAEQMADNSLGYTQVKVPRNDGTNLADYLLANVDISCLAIDGGGRKWFGTTNDGVYLISADNMEQIQHFTKDNSKLLSDNIADIAINGKTGEVFFGTDKGLCSYVSDATDTNNEMDKDNVYAYPNPVRPDYTGLITVVGLSSNADVKIITSNGALVAEGKSVGGSFTWDGCDSKGKRVVSGVYMVQTATSDGEKGTVCKIAIVR